MPCPKCNAKTKKGRPCKMRTCRFAPKCRHHTKVEIRQSLIEGAGRGLFARDDIKMDDTIADYTVGNRALDEAEFWKVYPSGKATHVALINGVYYDATDANLSISGMINRAPPKKRNNVRITKHGTIKANSNIKKGTELLLAYGKSYRL